MKLKKNVKRGLMIFTIYLITTIFIFMASDRIESLEGNNNSSKNISFNFNK